MSAQNGSALPQEASELAGKGKGKAADQAPVQDHAMDEEEDDEDEEEESGPEEVRFFFVAFMRPFN